MILTRLIHKLEFIYKISDRGGEKSEDYEHAGGGFATDEEGGEEGDENHGDGEGDAGVEFPAAVL